MFVTLILIFILTLSPLASSISSNPCERCHGSTYYQYLEIRPENSSEQVPSKLNLNQTKTVSVILQNNVNTAVDSELWDVSVKLNSAYGHFSVSNSTQNISNLPAGNITVTWQIAGVSEGYDYLIMEASASNPHYNEALSDNYFPYPLVTVGQPAGTPPPAPTFPPISASNYLVSQIIFVLAIMFVVIVLAVVLYKRRQKKMLTLNQEQEALRTRTALLLW